MMQRRDGTYREVSEALGVKQQTLRTWYIAEMARKKDKPPKHQVGAGGHPPDETSQQKLDRLERENKLLVKRVEQLEEDRAILKKAAAFFAKESE
jgi:transposase-like protein